MNQHPYARYSNSNEYQYPQQYEQEQEYQQGYQGYAPVPHQGQGPPVTHSQLANPFLAAPVLTELTEPRLGGLGRRSQPRLHQ